MAGTARKARTDSATPPVAKSRKSSRKTQPEVLMLDAELRVEDDRWDGLSVMDSDKVQLIAAAFASNRVQDGSFAEDHEPVDDKEKSEAARQTMRNLINGEPAIETGIDDRLARASITTTDSAFDAKLREIVRETLQEMFGTETGQKLSSGIRRMVRREIEMMIALERAS